MRLIKVRRRATGLERSGLSKSHADVTSPCLVGACAGVVAHIKRDPSRFGLSKGREGARYGLGERYRYTATTLVLRLRARNTCDGQISDSVPSPTLTRSIVFENRHTNTQIHKYTNSIVKVSFRRRGKNQNVFKITIGIGSLAVPSRFQTRVPRDSNPGRHEIVLITRQSYAYYTRPSINDFNLIFIFL